MSEAVCQSIIDAIDNISERTASLYAFDHYSYNIKLSYSEKELDLNILKEYDELKAATKKILKTYKSSLADGVLTGIERGDINSTIRRMMRALLLFYIRANANIDGGEQITEDLPVYIQAVPANKLNVTLTDEEMLLEGTLEADDVKNFGALADHLKKLIEQLTELIAYSKEILRDQYLEKDEIKGLKSRIAEKLYDLAVLLYHVETPG